MKHPSPEFYRDALAGFSGTSLAVLLEKFQADAAVIAGAATALWMLTQSVLAVIRFRNEKRQK